MRQPKALYGGLAAGLVVFLGFAYWGIELATREEPNYSLIAPGLYLGGSVERPPPGTTAVLNLCEASDSYQAEVQSWQPIADAEPAPTLDWLRQQVDFIDSQRRAGRVVYVHRRNGVSRSGMVVIAYLMSTNGWTCDEALAFVRGKRPLTRPNPAFMQRLAEWEQHVRGR
jgi:protein-tyrosine phosphatase